MEPNHDWGANMDSVDPKLGSYLEDDDWDDRPIPVMLRPSGDREAMINRLENDETAREIRPVATTSLRAEIPGNTLKRLMSSSLLEAVEIDRPVRTFDQGN
jgi:hypothetical protein